MPPPGPTFLPRRFAVLALACAGITLFTSRLGAQEQERKLLDRIMHPNMELHAEGFSKPFETKASNRDRQANVRAFAFGHSANLKAGDGAFHARSFNDGRGSFRTESFAVRRATAVDRPNPLGERSFAVGGFPVREDRAANLSANTHQYVDATKPYLVPGKRQDSIDDLRRQKNLTIDQVREILNKNR